MRLGDALLYESLLLSFGTVWLSVSGNSQGRHRAAWGNQPRRSCLRTQRRPWGTAGRAPRSRV